MTRRGWTLPVARQADGVTTALIRPEAIGLVPTAGSDAMPARVTLVTYLGPITEVVIELAGGDRLVAEQASGGWLDRVQPGQEIGVRIPPEAVIGLGADGPAIA